MTYPTIINLRAQHHFYHYQPASLKISPSIIKILTIMTQPISTGPRQLDALSGRPMARVLTRLAMAAY